MHFVLTGRDASQLAVTKAHIESARTGKTTTFDLFPTDLGNLSTLKASAERLFALATKSGMTSTAIYDRVIFINNAGSLGPLQAVGAPVDSAQALLDMTTAYEFNITSCTYLTAELTRRYTAGTLNATKLVIVNVSSLAAVQPFESWSIYCAGKAAREMFHKAVAAENKDKSDFRVLNYAPGPLDTDMQKEIREGPDVDKATQAMFITMKAENQLVTVKHSAIKLIRIVWNESYQSGDHVDYFDNVNGICGNVDCPCGTLCGCGETCRCGGFTPPPPPTAAATKTLGCPKNALCTCGINCQCTPCTCGIKGASTSCGSASGCGCCEGCPCGGKGGVCNCDPCTCCGSCSSNKKSTGTVASAAVGMETVGCATNQCGCCSGCPCGGKGGVCNCDPCTCCGTCSSNKKSTGTVASAAGTKTVGCATNQCSCCEGCPCGGKGGVCNCDPCTCCGSCSSNKKSTGTVASAAVGMETVGCATNQCGCCSGCPCGGKGGVCNCDPCTCCGTCSSNKKSTGTVASAAVGTKTVGCPTNPSCICGPTCSCGNCSCGTKSAT